MIPSSPLHPPPCQFAARAMDIASLPQIARAGGRLIAAAGQSVLDRFFYRFTCFTGALLNAA